MRDGSGARAGACGSGQQVPFVTMCAVACACTADEEEEEECEICMEPLESSCSIGCNHKFCSECWTEYLLSAVRAPCEPDPAVAAQLCLLLQAYRPMAVRHRSTAPMGVHNRCVRVTNARTNWGRTCSGSSCSHTSQKRGVRPRMREEPSPCLPHC